MPRNSRALGVASTLASGGAAAAPPSATAGPGGRLAADVADAGRVERARCRFERSEKSGIAERLLAFVRDDRFGARFLASFGMTLAVFGVTTVVLGIAEAAFGMTKMAF